MQNDRKVWVSAFAILLSACGSDPKKLETTTLVATPQVSPAYARPIVVTRGPLTQVKICSKEFNDRVQSLAENKTLVQSKLLQHLDAANRCSRDLKDLADKLDTACPNADDEFRALTDRADQCLITGANTQRRTSHLFALIGESPVPLSGELKDREVEKLVEALANPDRWNELAGVSNELAKTCSWTIANAKLSTAQADTRLEAIHCLRTAIAAVDSNSTFAPLSSKFAALTQPSVTTKTASGTLATPASSLQGMILQGLADFVAARAKQEVFGYVVKEFSEELCDSDGEGVEPRSLFPTTCNLLTGRYDVKSATLRDIGSTFQAALQQDLHGLLPAAINFATRQGGAGPTAEFFIGVAQKVHGGKTPLEAIEAQPFKRLQDACDEGKDYPCAFELAVTVVRKSNTALSGNCADEKCASAIQKAVKDAVDKREGLKAFVSDHLDDEEVGVPNEVVDAIRTLKSAKGPALIEATFVMFSEVVEEILPEHARTRAKGILDKARGIHHKWGDLALAMYRTIRGVARGDNPIPLLVATAEAVPCDDANDPGCGFRALGLLVESILTAEKLVPSGKRWSDIDLEDVTELDQFIQAARFRWKTLLVQPGNAIVDSWVSEHIENAGLAQARWLVPDELSDREVGDLLQKTLEALLRLKRALDVAKATGEKPPTGDENSEPRETASRLVVKATFDVWRAAAPLVVPKADQAHVARVVDLLEQTTVAARDRDWAGFLSYLHALATEIGSEDPIPDGLQQYVPLITAMATAKSADDVSAALDRFAAPVGSYATKREDGAHYSLTALVGATGGYEWADEEDIQLAVFAPVGVEVSWGGCRACGFFASLVDIGALTATSLGFVGDSDPDAPDPTFAQVLSLGIYSRVAVCGPFVVGVGGSFIPALRDGDDSTTTPDDSFRLNAFIAADVTILPF